MATNKDINVKGIFWFGFPFNKEAGWVTQVNIVGNSIMDCNDTFKISLYPSKKMKLKTFTCFPMPSMI